ncbi:MAG: transporter family protein [Verrucomicrobiales bacterium]|jgi:transporter family protein
MDWVLLSILSALCLGVYDLLKKHAVRDNAVLPVLFFGVVAGAAFWTPFLIWSALAPESLPFGLGFFKISALSPTEHSWLFAKSALVATSWLFGYFALKHLPLSTAGPIRATGPLWTIVIAVTFMGEVPRPAQWVGVAIILAAFYAFSFVGKLEGIHFHKNRWVLFMIAATVFGACSSIYDKFLLQRVGLAPSTVQAWFSLYLVVVLAPFYIMWRRGLWTNHRFQWRWSIPLIGISLLVADILYFNAVSDPEALISVISPIRRMAVLVTFTGGVVIYGERQFLRPKLVCLAALLVGVIWLSF